MSKNLSVLFVSPEVYPYSNETTIAQFSYSFTLALSELGHDSRLMMPKFGNVSERKNRIHDINRLRDLTFDMNGRSVIGSVKSSSLTNGRNKVQGYITTNEDYFGNFKGAFHHQSTWEEHPDPIERFIYFSKTVVETCVTLNWFPQIIHCNEWQAALIPAYAKKLYPEKFAKTRFVLTVHDFNSQGIGDSKLFELLGLPDKIKDDFIKDGKLNMLKGGLQYADYITTITKYYAEEVLKSEELSGGFNKLLQKRKVFEGINNKIDPWTWNPRNDDLLETQYEEDIDEFKYHNKVALINKFELEYHPKTPLIVSEYFYDNKEDIELFLESADELLKENLQFVILVPGDKELEKRLKAVAKKHKDNFRYIMSYTENLGSEFLAGSDMYLISPKFDSPGIKFMQACLYGSVPLARLTPTIKEIAQEFDKEEEEGNSINFIDFTKKDFMKAVKKALDIYKDKELWRVLARNGMIEEFDWEENILKYENIYKKVLKKK